MALRRDAHSGPAPVVRGGPRPGGDAAARARRLPLLGDGAESADLTGRRRRRLRAQLRGRHEGPSEDGTLAHRRRRLEEPLPHRRRESALVAGRHPCRVPSGRPDLRALDGRRGRREPGNAARQPALPDRLGSRQRLHRVPCSDGPGARPGVGDRHAEGARRRRVDGAATDRHPAELPARRSGVLPAGLPAHLRRERRRGHPAPAHQRRLPPRRAAFCRRRVGDRLHVPEDSGCRARLARVGDLSGRGGHRPDHHPDEPHRSGLGAGALAGRRHDRLHRDGPHHGHLPGGRPLRHGRRRGEPAGHRHRDGSPSGNRGLGG